MQNCTIRPNKYSRTKAYLPSLFSTHLLRNIRRLSLKDLSPFFDKRRQHVIHFFFVAVALHTESIKAQFPVKPLLTMHIVNKCVQINLTWPDLIKDSLHAGHAQGMDLKYTMDSFLGDSIHFAI